MKNRQLGEGIVIACEGEGAYARIQVKFSSENKWLMLAYAGLESKL